MPVVQLVFITLTDGRLKLCSTFLPYKIAIIALNRVSSELPVFATRSRSSAYARHPFILLKFLAITVSALFVHYRWKINGSADIMAAFHTQKRLGGVFITTLPFKNILWSNHISSTTLPYGIHVLNNLRV